MMANRTVLGEFDGDYVLRVSRPGHNVLNPNLARKNLAFDSRWPETMQVIDSGRVFWAGGVGGSPLTFPHGGEASTTGAVVMLWIERNGVYAKLDTAFSAAFGSLTFRGWSDLTTVYVQRLSTGSNNVDVWIQFVTLRQSNG